MKLLFILSLICIAASAKFDTKRARIEKVVKDRALRQEMERRMFEEAIRRIRAGRPINTGAIVTNITPTTNRLVFRLGQPGPDGLHFNSEQHNRQSNQ